jgi:hypothetical protein
VRFKSTRRRALTDDMVITLRERQPIIKHRHTESAILMQGADGNLRLRVPPLWVHDYPSVPRFR